MKNVSRDARFVHGFGYLLHRLTEHSAHEVLGFCHDGAVNRYPARADSAGDTFAGSIYADRRNIEHEILAFLIEHSQPV